MGYDLCDDFFGCMSLQINLESCCGVIIDTITESVKGEVCFPGLRE